MNLSEIIGHHADRYPQRIAVSSADGPLTYEDLYARVQRCAGALRELGISRSDIVAVLLHNCADFLELMLASSHVGAIFMPLNWRLSAPELTYIADHAGAKLVVSEPQLRDRFDDLRAHGGERVWATLGRGDERWRSLDDAGAAAQPVIAAEEVEGDDVMRLMYTSGTTSRPKGVMITYATCSGSAPARWSSSRRPAGTSGWPGPAVSRRRARPDVTNMLYIGGRSGSCAVRRRRGLDAIEREKVDEMWLAPAMVKR